MGFWLCDWCGYGAARALHRTKPPAHKHLLRTTRATASRLARPRAHYETDLLTLDIALPGATGSPGSLEVGAVRRFEAACEVWNRRDDIGGSLTPIGARLVDRAVRHRLRWRGSRDTVEAATRARPRRGTRRVCVCECGPETSCLRCLRSYGNQRDHDELSRGAAEQILTRLLAGSGTIDPAYTLPITTSAVAGADLDPAWAELHVAASTAEQAVLLALEEAGTLRPELGFESAGGIPIPLAWPDRLLAADLGLDDADRDDLKAEGWKVVEPGTKLVQAAMP